MSNWPDHPYAMPEDFVDYDAVPEHVEEEITVPVAVACGRCKERFESYARLLDHAESYVCVKGAVR